MNTPNINLNSMYNEFSNNPIQFLVKSKFNLPQNIGNNPQMIIQHLLSSGQLTQQQLTYAQNLMPQMRALFSNKS